MTPTEIEQAVFELEEVRIVIRAPIKARLGDFLYARQAANNASISEWLNQRIKPLVPDHTVVVVDGTGTLPNSRTSMATLRQSYVR
jgi:hypothetical protein